MVKRFVRSLEVLSVRFIHAGKMNHSSVIVATAASRMANAQTCTLTNGSTPTQCLGSAALDLFINGLNIGSEHLVSIDPIGFGGVFGTTATALDDIAKMDPCGTISGSFPNNVSAQTASNEEQRSQALSSIIISSIQSEVCNHPDDRCNDDVDQGYNHFCNSNPLFCAWASASQRALCLSNIEASISTTQSQGDRRLLPSTTGREANDCSTWLCYEYGEVCDDADNKCNNTTDEEMVERNGHCPETEVCKGQDDGCHGIVDEAPGKPNSCSILRCTACVLRAEICDGCDNDCDGLVGGADGDLIGVGQVCDGSCDKGTTAWVNGVLVCQSSVQGQIQAQPEACDGVDNKCNGIPDVGNWLDGPLCQLGTISCLGGVWTCSGGMPLRDEHACPEGSYHDPVTGAFDNHFDVGVLRSTGQDCELSECVAPVAVGVRVSWKTLIVDARVMGQRRRCLVWL